MLFHPLSLDLYEIMMAMTYLESEMEGLAAFEYFVRGPYKDRNFLIAAGLETLLDFLEHFEITQDHLDALERFGLAPDRLQLLKGLRFTGTVEAMPEGTFVFPEEPLIRITAPIAEAQLVETAAINILHFQTLIASKAIRSVIAAHGKRLVDFGLRRAHGGEAGLLAARSCYIAGFDATSNALAGLTYRIPVSGTMAHSFIQAHDTEDEAFFNFAIHNSDNVVLLIDTYDTVAGARRAARLAGLLADRGIQVRGVRIDSGALLSVSRSVRKILDDAGQSAVAIVASGDLDEYKIQRLVHAHAPIDSFGIGTKLDVSADRPYLDCAYKLVEYSGVPRFKLSPGKRLLPGRKQVFRERDPDGTVLGDVIGLSEEDLPGVPLLKPVMRRGQRLYPPEASSSIRDRVMTELQHLPPEFKNLEKPQPSPVRISDKLAGLLASLIAKETSVPSETPSPSSAHNHDRGAFTSA